MSHTRIVLVVAVMMFFLAGTAEAQTYSINQFNDSATWANATGTSDSVYINLFNWSYVTYATAVVSYNGSVYLNQTNNISLGSTSAPTSISENGTNLFVTDEASNWDYYTANGTFIETVSFESPSFTISGVKSNSTNFLIFRNTPDVIELLDSSLVSIRNITVTGAAGLLSRLEADSDNGIMRFGYVLRGFTDVNVNATLHEFNINTGESTMNLSIDPCGGSGSGNGLAMVNGDNSSFWVNCWALGDNQLRHHTIGGELLETVNESGILSPTRDFHGLSTLNGINFLMVNRQEIGGPAFNFTYAYPQNITIDTGNDGFNDVTITELNWTNQTALVNLNVTAINNIVPTSLLLQLNVSQQYPNTIVLENLTINYTYHQITQCGGVSNTTTLYIEFRDEDTNELVNTNIEAVIHTDTSDGLQNYTFDLRGDTNYSLCIYPTTATFPANATMKYTNNGTNATATNYSTRYNFLRNYIFDSIPDNATLYLLKSADSSQITFIIKDIYNLPQADIVVKITRFFISEGVYRLVTMGLSDFAGEAITQLKLNEWYIFIIERDGVILRTYPQKFLATTDDITLYTSEGGLIEYFSYVDSLGASCTPNMIAELLTCTFSDTSGRMANLNLSIERQQLVGGFVDVCFNTTTASSGTISCSFAGYNTTDLEYVLVGSFTGLQPTVFTLLTGSIRGVVSAPFGLTGVIIMIFILMAAVLYGYWNPTVPIIMGLFGVMIGMVLGLIVISMASFMSLVIAGGIILYKMRS